MKNQNINKILLDILDKDLDKIARKTNFKTRNSKLNPHDFLWICCLSNHNLCANTLEELCDSLFFHKNIKISPQALDQRIKNNSQKFFKHIFSLFVKYNLELIQNLAIGESKEFEFLLGSHKEKTSYRVILTRMDEEFKNNKLKTIRKEGRKEEKRKKQKSDLARSESEVSGFVTNLWSGSAEEIMEIYRLRWQIEILFKILKSDFDLKKIRKLKIERIESHIYATLIKFMLTLEITKEINGGYIPEISIRRILKRKKD